MTAGELASDRSELHLFDRRTGAALARSAVSPKFARILLALWRACAEFVDDRGHRDATQIAFFAMLSSVPLAMPLVWPGVIAAAQSDVKWASVPTTPVRTYRLAGGPGRRLAVMTAKGGVAILGGDEPAASPPLRRRAGRPLSRR